MPLRIDNFLACRAIAMNGAVRVSNMRGSALLPPRKPSRPTFVSSCWLALTLATGSLAAAQTPQPTVYRTLPLDISVREVPTAVPLTDGSYHVAYVMFVTNWLDRDITLRNIDIGAEGGGPIAHFDSAALTNPYRFRSTFYVRGNSANRAALVLQSGRTALVNVEFTSAAASLPPLLVHTLRFARDSAILIRSDDGTASPDLFSRSPAIATGSRPLVIDAPLRGGPWRCGNGLAFDNAHAAVYPFRVAQLRVPQRFGCDFLKTDSAGSTLPNPFPDTITNSMFYGYGAEVLAVGDGVIEYVMDGIPENVPQIDGRTIMPVPLTNETVSGNWVSLRLRKGVYAFYAHLQPRSVRVRVGQRIRRGQMIGLVGNSGNSAAPHLHFHLGNANSLNGSDAVPHVYRSFIWLGDNAPDRVPEQRTNQLPSPSAIIRFP